MRHYLSILISGGSLLQGVQLASGMTELSLIFICLALMGFFVTICNAITGITKERGDELWEWACEEHELLMGTIK